MPNHADIHKFFENNLPGYQRKDDLKTMRFFLEQTGLSTKKPIKEFLANFKYLNEWICFEWLGEDEIKTKPPPKDYVNHVPQHNKKKKKMIHHDKLTDQSLMPYGKYQGQKLANVPPDYLIWLFENDKCSESVKAYVKENKSFLELELKQNRKNQNR